MNEVETFSEHVVTDDALEHTLTTIDAIRWYGNIIPFSWQNHIKTPDGNVHLVAMHLLAEIVYWYQPNRYRDEQTDEEFFVKRFKGSCYCPFSASLERQLGVSTETIQEGLDLLVSLNLISVQIEHGRTSDYLSSQRYAIGINAEKIAHISQPFGEWNDE